MSTKNYFLSVIFDEEPGTGVEKQTLFCFNSNLLFPEINVDEVYPELELFIETLESFYGGEIRFFYSFGASECIDESLSETCEDLVFSHTSRARARRNTLVRDHAAGDFLPGLFPTRRNLLPRDALQPGFNR